MLGDFLVLNFVLFKYLFKLFFSVMIWPFFANILQLSGTFGDFLLAFILFFFPLKKMAFFCTCQIERPKICLLIKKKIVD